MAKIDTVLLDKTGTLTYGKPEVTLIEPAYGWEPDELLEIAAAADIGAGTGYFTIRLARRVGPEGMVYANDVQPEMLDRILEKSQKLDLKNIETVLGTEADPKLPAGMMDLVLLVDVYHEFSQPQRMLQAIRASLKPDGRLVLLEYRKEDPAVRIKEVHKMSVIQLQKEMNAVGLAHVRTVETLPLQHIVIFEKRN